MGKEMVKRTVTKEQKVHSGNGTDGPVEGLALHAKEGLDHGGQFWDSEACPAVLWERC